MVIDTSAILAILQNEPERPTFHRAIAAAGCRWLAVPSFVEISIVIEAHVGATGCGEPVLFLNAAVIVVMALDRQQADIARETSRRYGNGHHHRTGLYFGDRFSYALAQRSESSLQSRGNEFVFTDLQVACKIYPSTGSWASANDIAAR
jgi:ribonuclease VapC